METAELVKLKANCEALAGALEKVKKQKAYHENTSDNWHQRFLAERTKLIEMEKNLESTVKEVRDEHVVHATMLKEEAETLRIDFAKVKERARIRLNRLRGLEDQLAGLGQKIDPYMIVDDDDLNAIECPCGVRLYDAIEMTHIQARRLREELIARSKNGDKIRKLEEENVKLKGSTGSVFVSLRTLRTRIRNLQNANTALNKALVQAEGCARQARSNLGNEIEARKSWEWEASKANSRADLFKESNDDYEKELVKIIEKGETRQKQFAEMIKEGEIRAEAFERWEDELEAPSEEGKIEKSKLAKEKRRLLVSISGYGADVLKTLFNRTTPVFIVAIVAIALVKIYG